jgi:hypothetical protein
MFRFRSSIDFFTDTVCCKCGLVLSPFSISGSTKKVYCDRCRGALTGAALAELTEQDRRDELIRQVLVSAGSLQADAGRKPLWRCQIV